MNEPNKSDTPRTDAAMKEVERIHTKVGKNVTTSYKAAFYALGNDMADLERELARANKDSEIVNWLQAICLTPGKDTVTFRKGGTMIVKPFDFRDAVHTTIQAEKEREG